ncbi:MAG: hypothetical protein RhofKO_20500 [Rhodothermales bacterium]
MRLSTFQRIQAYSLLLALVVGGVGYPLAHAVEHHIHAHAHGEGIHGHVHTDEVSFSVGVPEADYHSLDCAYCLTVSSALVAPETGVAVYNIWKANEQIDAVWSKPSMYRSDAPRGPPHQG